MTTHWTITTWAQKRPESAAIVAANGGSLAYAELLELVLSVGCALRARAIGPHDRVGIVLPNGPVSATSFLAVSSAATAAPLNPKYGKDEFRFYLEDSKAKAVILLAGDPSPARQAAAELGLDVIEIRPEGAPGCFVITGSEQSASDAFDPADSSNIALVLHTSGTTSRPKLVPLTHANLCTSARNVAEALKLTDADKCLNVMPLFHIHGLVAALLGTLSAGGSIVCTPGFDAQEFGGWLERLSPTWYTAVPTMHQAVLAVLEETPSVARSAGLRFVRSSSASLPTPVISRLEKLFGVPVVEAYGMTEASHQMTSNPLPPAVRKPGSVGVAAGPRVGVMGEDGTLLSEGQIGEVVIQGPTVTAGYESGSIELASPFANGWFRTGDQGRIDEDGYLFLTGRLKEIINRGGEKVAPAEVDEVLLAHEGILEAVTFAVPHPTLGEDVVSAVVARDGKISEMDMREFAFSRLAEVKVPSRVLFVQELPKGATGKIQRIGMADRLAEHLETTFMEPDGTVETSLAEIWGEVIRAKRVGARDNFFALGGDSLMAAQVVARIRSRFGVEMPLAAVFRDPSLRGMAARIELLVLDELDAKSA